MSPRRKKHRNRRTYAREKFWKRHKGNVHTCHWCGRFCFRNLPPDNPYKATIEHLVPISKGGDNRLTNLTVSCYSCNTARQDVCDPNLMEVIGVAPEMALPVKQDYQAPAPPLDTNP